MSYDQGYWHYDTCDEMGLPEENAATHIVAYLKWCIHRNFISESIENEDVEALANIRSGTDSVAEYFENRLDWKLGEWCLNEVGNKFTSAYYQRYLNDLTKHFPQIVYGAECDVDFDSLSTVLDKRLSEFLIDVHNNQPDKNRPWWKWW